MEAKDLKIGDVFLGANGELSTLVDIERIEMPEGVKVYNFTVEGNHNYFVIAATDELGQTCVLVHNQSDGPIKRGWAWLTNGKGWKEWGTRVFGIGTSAPVPVVRHTVAPLEAVPTIIKGGDNIRSYRSLIEELAPPPRMISVGETEERIQQIRDRMERIANPIP